MHVKQPKERMTSEDREILRAKEETENHRKEKAKWELFYERVIKGSKSVSYEEHMLS